MAGEGLLQGITYVYRLGRKAKEMGNLSLTSAVLRKYFAQYMNTMQRPIGQVDSFLLGGYTTWPARPLDGPHETTYRSAVFCLLYISEKLPNAFAHI